MEVPIDETGQDHSRPLRIAIEGCGHGTLDAIYTSISKSCQVKGWDAVDLVIICGDFQAVRDHRDLNVTAMPAKYREMADFHQYYWGKKKAPFLTIFIGGNHEASNHLWELYYGGWVAPNIYYLGAANVVQFGSLKIAGMSGIWKGYDYKKPHYERLPYSSDDMYSIYHVRELDIRKLLAYRSQVDIGLSHDWPRGIEWLGDHRELFIHKTFLKEDADKGTLGNVAAKQVLDRLRPRYWFSAHLHVRYAAVQKHQNHDPGLNHDTESTDNQASHATVSQDGQKLAAWHNFQAAAKEDEDQQREKVKNQDEPMTAGYTLNETYKRVKLDDGFSRTVASVTTNEHSGSLIAENNAPPSEMSQLDGCCSSLPTKRQHNSNDGNVSEVDRILPAYIPINVDGTGMSTNIASITTNPDAIDLESDDDTDSIHASVPPAPAENEASPLLVQTLNDDGDRQQQSINSSHLPTVDGSFSRTNSTILGSGASKSNLAMQNGSAVGNDLDTNLRGSIAQTSEEVSEEMRAQLAALSAKFADVAQVETSAPLPHPEAIKNQETRFLALSKCAPDQRFLQLMEIQADIPDQTERSSAPKLRYDPEWLAILRVFSQELKLDGDARESVPPHRGDTYYRDRIIEEEKWVNDNIVKTDLLDVPANFDVTLSADNSDANSTTMELPVEATNHQTTTFCQLIGIENKFDFSDADREARQTRGPSQSSDSGRGGSRGRRGNHGGRGGGFHRGRGGRGGRGRGRRH